MKTYVAKHILVVPMIGVLILLVFSSVSSNAQEIKGFKSLLLGMTPKEIKDAIEKDSSIDFVYGYCGPSCKERTWFDGNTSNVVTFDFMGYTGLEGILYFPPSWIENRKVGIPKELYIIKIFFPAVNKEKLSSLTKDIRNISDVLKSKFGPPDLNNLSYWNPDSEKDLDFRNFKDNDNVIYMEWKREGRSIRIIGVNYESKFQAVIEIIDWPRFLDVAAFYEKIKNQKEKQIQKDEEQNKEKAVQDF